MIYNTKLIQYANGKCQLRFYSQDIHISDDITEIMKDKREDTINNSDSVVTDPELLIYQSKNRTINKIYDIARSNIWDYFGTFTLDPKKVNRQNYDDCLEAVNRFCRYLKDFYCPELSYLIIPELHKDGKSYHFHALLGNALLLPVKEAINPHTGEFITDSKGRYVYNVPDYIFGFCTVTRVQDNFAAIAYMTKYVTKELCDSTQGKHRYIVSKNVGRPFSSVAKLTQEEFNNMLIRPDLRISFMKSLGQDEYKMQIIELDNLSDSILIGLKDRFVNFEEVDLY